MTYWSPDGRVLMHRSRPVLFGVRTDGAEQHPRLRHASEHERPLDSTEESLCAAVHDTGAHVKLCTFAVPFGWLLRGEDVNGK